MPKLISNASDVKSPSPLPRLMALVVLSLFSFSVMGQEWKGFVSTAWEDPQNWSTLSVPTVANDITIPANPTGGRFPVISTGTVGVNDIFIEVGATVTQTGGTLEIKNDWRNRGSFNATGGTVHFIGSAAGAAEYTGTNQFFDVIIDPGVNPRISNTSNAILSIAGNFTNLNSSLANPINSTFNFNGTGDQTISTASTSATFGQLVINKAQGKVSLLTSLRIAGDINVTSGIFELGTHLAERTTNGGTLTVGATGVLRLAGNTGGQTGSNFPLTFTSRVLASGSTVEYNGSDAITQTIFAGVTYSNLTITNGSAAGNANKITTANLLVNGSLTINAGATVTPAAATTVGGTGTLTGTGTAKVTRTTNTADFLSQYTITNKTLINLTVDYDATTNQTVSAVNYGNLVISGNRGSNNVILSNSGVIGIAGSFSPVATFAAGNYVITGSTVAFNGAGAQVIEAFTFNNLTISKVTGTVTLAGNININNTLSFVSGKITTGTNRVIIDSNGSVSGAGQSTGWVIGNLQKAIATGSTVARTFEVGGSNYYAPVTVELNSVAIGGSLIATAIDNDHPQINGSNLDGAKSVNRYWSFTRNTFTFTSGNILFNWNTADADANVTASNLAVSSFNGTTWTSHNVNSATTNSIKANGIVFLNQFVVAENKPTTVTWTGLQNSNYTTANNWNPAFAPNSNVNVVIPAGLTNYPVVGGTTVAAKNITINSGASLVVSGGIEIFGTLTNNGTFNVSNAAVSFKGSTAQNIPANAFTNNTIKQLIIDNGSGVNLLGSLSITDVLTISNGSLNTGGYLTLKSNAVTTAQVSPITSTSPTPIVGDVTVERYVPGRRKYRLITSSVTTSPNATLAAGQEARSIWGNWQVSGSNAQQNLGTSITGGTAADGYDQITTNPSLFSYNSQLKRFVAVSSANGKNTKYTPLKAGEAFYMFVYGDRQNSAAASSPRPTILKATGTLLTGDQVYSPATPIAINATQGNFSMIGNPYASAIDWKYVQLRDVSRILWTWDPNLNSTGGFVTVNSTSSGDIISPISDLVKTTRFVQPGQGFFVQTIGPNPLITIKEIHKWKNDNTAMFRTNENGTEEPSLIAINLLYTASTGPVLADGVVAAFDPNFSNDITEEDGIKMAPVNNAEYVSLAVGNKELSIDTRNIPSGNDTLFLNTLRLTRSQYKLQILLKNLAPHNIQAYLEDSYLNARIPLLHTDTNYIPFNVFTSDAASAAANRFKIVFEQSSVLPVAFVSVKAEAKSNTIQVDWKVATEAGIKKYEILKSISGSNFQKIGEVSATGNGTTFSEYTFNDNNVMNGYNYYQVQAIHRDGTSLLSKVVSVRMEQKGEIRVLSNPVRDQKISISLQDMTSDKYTLTIFNTSGQQVFNKVIDHKGGSFNYSFNFEPKVAAGIYHLKIISGGTSFGKSIIID